MSDQPVSPTLRDVAHLAEPVAVATQDGRLLVGWGVRQDTVVVETDTLEGPVTVAIGERHIETAELFESSSDVGTGQPLTALQLPEGSLNLAGELFPPRMLPEIPDPDEPQTMGARVSFWCIVFRRMRGC